MNPSGIPVSIGSSNPNLPQFSGGSTYQIKHCFHSNGSYQTWLQVSATLVRGGNNSYGLAIDGKDNQGTDRSVNVHLTQLAQHQINETVRLLIAPRPQNQRTVVNINMHTGNAIWSWRNTSLLLASDRFAHTFPNLGRSFLDFVTAALPPHVLSALGNTPLTAPATAPNRHLQQPLGNLPQEVLQSGVGSNLTLAAYSAMTRVNQANSAIFQWSLNSIEEMAFAGKKVVYDHNGNQLIGADGTPLRAYPPVIGQNGKPVIDQNGHVVRQSILNQGQPKYLHYFNSPPNQCPPVLDQNGNQVRDINGNIVRRMPTLNAAYYTDALQLIQTQPGTRAFKLAALNALTDAIRSHPVPEYTPQVTFHEHRHGATVAFHPDLIAALQSPNPRIRDWAQERLVDAYIQYRFVQHGRYVDARDAIVHQLVQIGRYQPITINATQGSRTRTTVEYGRNHKAMLCSPNHEIRRLGQEVSEIVRAQNRPNMAIHVLDNQRQNQVHRFPTQSNHLRQVTRVLIPEKYDVWLSPRSIEERRLNLDKLGSLLREQHGTQPAATARGFAEYLVRNIADWPQQRIEQILYSDEVLHTGTRHFSLQRVSFLQELGQRGPNGSIPTSIVTEVGVRMRIVARNDWAQKTYESTSQRQLGRGLEFEIWASKQKIDLVGLIDALQQQGSPFEQVAKQRLRQIIDDFSQGDAGKRMEAYGMMNWLVQNLNIANAPQ